MCLLLAMAAGAGACSSDGSDRSSPAGSSTTTTVSRDTGPPYDVNQIELRLVDRSRRTPQNGTYAGAPTRTIVTLVSLPVGAPRPLPLVVFSTGIGGTATNYEGLYKHWVEAGYAVAAPVFPLSNADAPGGSTIADFGEQPGDVRFVLDELLRMTADKHDRLVGTIDPTRIALVGKSLGALTTLRAAFLVGDHESREKAVISLTGGSDGSKKFFTGIAVPILLVHGDADKTVPYRSSVRAFDSALPPKYLVTLFGQDHGGAFNGEQTAAGKVVVDVTLDFLDAYLRKDPAAIDRLTKDATVADVASIRTGG
jgi:dienelactone hydrolase